jgi:hypothetical protein
MSVVSAGVVDTRIAGRCFVLSTDAVFETRVDPSGASAGADDGFAGGSAGLVLPGGATSRVSTQSLVTIRVQRAIYTHLKCIRQGTSN